MRIRKRQVPLPLSSLCPVPLSDPLVHRTPVVQLQHKPSNPPHNLHPSPTGGGIAGWVPADDAREAPNKNNGSRIWGTKIADSGCTTHGRCDFWQEKKSLRVEDDGDEEEGGQRNDTRERTIVGAETSDGFLPDSSSSSQVGGRWCEREKTFPLKKRRGNFERKEEEEEETSDKKTMKTKMNKKFTQKEDEEPKPETDQITSSSGGGKKKSRGGPVMEGSRCSRVNGRGWRCCQQTLVGYSLCEHHLGKGRLRSMNSVRRQSSATAHRPPAHSLSPERDRMSHRFGIFPIEEEDEKKPLTPAIKKRMKLGVVKARSISSLLGQTDHVTAAAPVDSLNK